MKKKNDIDYMDEIMQWLTKSEEKFGLNATREALNKLDKARELWYQDIGYNLTRKQFERLNEAKNEKVQVEITENVRPDSRKYINKKGVEKIINFYRNIAGQFTENPFSKKPKN